MHKKPYPTCRCGVTFAHRIAWTDHECAPAVEPEDVKKSAKKTGEPEPMESSTPTPDVSRDSSVEPEPVDEASVHYEQGWRSGHIQGYADAEDECTLAERARIKGIIEARDCPCWGDACCWLLNERELLAAIGGDDA